MFLEPLKQVSDGAEQGHPDRRESWALEAPAQPAQLRLTLELFFSVCPSHEGRSIISVLCSLDVTDPGGTLSTS